MSCLATSVSKRYRGNSAMACWSDDHCIKCGIRFVVGNIIPRAEATLQSSQLPIIGDEETAPVTYAEDAIVQETVESPTLAADVDDLAVADEPAEETDTTEEAAPETHGVSPVTWLSNGVEVKMEDFDNLREACGSQSKFIRMKAEKERSTALRRGTTVATDAVENDGAEHMALDANILLALSEAQVKREGEAFPLPTGNVYTVNWASRVLASGRITWAKV